MAQFTLAIAATDASLVKNDIFIYDGMRYPFTVNPLGTAYAECELSTFDGVLTEAMATKLITEKVGVVVQGNPSHADVTTDDGANGDSTAGDGINDGTRYGWLTNQALYSIVAVPAP